MTIDTNIEKECDGLYVRCSICGAYIVEREWEAHASHPCPARAGGGAETLASREVPLIMGGQGRTDQSVADDGVIAVVIWIIALAGAVLATLRLVI
jgi:hypothetical protein